MGAVTGLGVGRVAGAGAHATRDRRCVLVGACEPACLGARLARDLLRDHGERQGAVCGLRRERSDRLRSADLVAPRSAVPGDGTQDRGKAGGSRSVTKAAGAEARGSDRPATTRPDTVRQGGPFGRLVYEHPLTAPLTSAEGQGSARTSCSRVVDVAGNTPPARTPRHRVTALATELPWSPDSPIFEGLAARFTLRHGTHRLPEFPELSDHNPSPEPGTGSVLASRSARPTGTCCRTFSTGRGRRWIRPRGSGR